MPTWYLAGTERYRGPVFAPAGGGPTTFDPVTGLSLATLSNVNLTATSTAANGTAQTTRSHNSGQYYAEFRWDTITNSFDALWGIIPATGSNYPTDFTLAQNGFLQSPAGTNRLAISAPASGGVARMAVDFGNKLAWYALDGGNWNAASGVGDPTNPSTGLGIDITTALTNGPYIIQVFMNVGGEVVTANFGPSYAFTKPAGYSDW